MNENLSTADIEYVKERLDNIERELIQLKKITILGKAIDTDKTRKAWNELMELSGKISNNWKGLSAVDEIRSQRGK